MADMEKLPLLRGQFVWIVTRTDGKMVLAVGPSAFDLKDDELLLVPDPNNYRKLNPVPKEHAMKAVQDYVYVEEDEYAVIHNPTESFNQDHPNGRLDKERTDTMTLLPGQKRIITKGSIPVWPRQKVEKRKIHRLSASQYLMVEVLSDEIDEKAPYYDLLVKCAKLKTAVVDATVAEEEETEKITDALSDKDSSDSPSSDVDLQISSDKKDEGAESTEEKNEEEKEPKKVESETTGSDDGKSSSSKLKVGQRIIIPGSATETFIPPTGTDVVSEEQETQVEEEVDVPLPSQSDEEVIKEMISSGVLKIETAAGILEEAGWRGDIDDIRYYYNEEREEGRTRDALWTALIREVDEKYLRTTAQLARKRNPKTQKQKVSKTVSSDDIVREAVVLGPTEYCVLIDENGSPNSKAGPGRVFPGPNDTFRTEGSRDRVYDAYHLRPDRGILLRVVADKISRKELETKLPVGSEKALDETQKTEFVKGDEIFISGFDAYLVPHSNTFEVIDPVTRNPHIGNDHSQAYVQSIGVDQKSGVYVMNVETGEVELVKGEKKLLLDPRKQKHVKRLVPGRLWNLLIGYHEKHKRVDPDDMVETPWALSVQVSPNMAMLVTSAKGRRVVKGPCTELLGFDETVQIIKISTGRPKQEEEVKETGYLRVTGNQPTDQIVLVTADKANLTVDVQYTVEFYVDGETDAQKAASMEKWFLYKNYIWLLCAHTRSRLRAAAEQINFSELRDSVTDFTRDTILGKKPAGETAHRPGLDFPACNMRVVEVEVLDYSIDDPVIQQELDKANQAMVTQDIQDSALRAKLASEKERDKISAEQAALRLAQTKRSVDTSIEESKIKDEGEAARVELDKEQTKRLSEAEVALAKIAEEAAIARDEIAKQTTKRVAETEIEKTKIAEDLAEQKAEIEKTRTKRNEDLSLLKAASDNKVKEATAELGHKLDMLLAEKGAELATKRDEERTRAAGVQRDITEADTKSQLALKDEARKKVAEFRELLSKTSIEMAKAEAEADAARISALQEKLVEAIEGLGNKQVLSELAKHLPATSGPLGGILSKGGVEALRDLLKGIPLKDGINPLVSTKEEVQRTADYDAEKDISKSENAEDD